MLVFEDRHQAGAELAKLLEERVDPLAMVLALPRGGIPVAFEVATTLGLPLDVLIVRKLGVPTRKEFAFGAIGEGGVRVLNPNVIRMVGLTESEMARVERHERREVLRRVEIYRGGRPPLELDGRPVLIVDDGLATGATARAAVQVARAKGAGRVTVAVPVGALSAIHDLEAEADEVIAVEAPTELSAIGLWYRDFHQISDETATSLLASAASRY